MSSDNQQDLTSGILKVNRSTLGESREGEKTPGGRVVESQKTELSSEGNKGAGQRHLPHPPPQQKSQREPVPLTELACTAQTPNTVLLWIHPSEGTTDGTAS